MSDGVTVDASAPLTFGGNVNTVLESPRAVMPPKTLEEARNQPGRREEIAQIAKRIESELTYPGEIRVTVIRETRAVEYAR